MRKIILSMVIATMVSSAMADISVNWTSSGFVADHTGGFATSDRYLQLIWSSADPIANQAVWGAPQNLASGEYQLYAGSDNGWASFALTDFDGPNVYTAANVGTANINSGYLFVRVFESSTVVSSTKYYQSTALSPALKTYSAIDPTSIIDYDCTGGTQTANTAMAVVPEPSTVGLLLVGAGLVAFRRVRRG